MNSKRKGARRELELAKFLTAHGFPARRGQQFKGTEDSPDVECDSLPLHIECKARQKLSLPAWVERARTEAGYNRTAAVFTKRNRGRWLVTLDAEDFLRLMESNAVSEREHPRNRVSAP